MSLWHDYLPLGKDSIFEPGKVGEHYVHFLLECSRFSEAQFSQFLGLYFVFMDLLLNSRIIDRLYLYFDAVAGRDLLNCRCKLVNFVAFVKLVKDPVFTFFRGDSLSLWLDTV